MRTSAVIEHYGTKAAVAAALDLKVPSVYEWGEFPPPLRQIQIEMLTGGRLKAEPACYGQAKAVPEGQPE